MHDAPAILTNNMAIYKRGDHLVVVDCHTRGVYLLVLLLTMGSGTAFLNFFIQALNVFQGSSLQFLVGICSLMVTLAVVFMYTLVKKMAGLRYGI